MGERVGFQLNEAYVFLGVYLLQTHKCFIISVMIKKSPIEHEYDAKKFEKLYLKSWEKLLTAFFGVEEP